jgi:tripartite ATP-independent transporter DctM subunit
MGHSALSIISAITPLILAMAIGVVLVAAPLSNHEIAVIALLLVVVLVYIGVHIGVALSAISFFAIWGIRDDVFIAGKMLSLAASESLKRFEFGIIPLFILMGTLISVSDVGADLYKVANQLFRRLKGGLGMATVFANAIFAAVTGTSIASASVFTKVAVPEMIRFGYHPRFAVGVVAGSSVLGMLSPPSMLMILFGILSESSIGDLFIAGIVPGIVLSIAYSLMIYIMATRFPHMIQIKDHKAPDDRLMPVAELVRKLLPIMALITLILGGIYGGLFTATEAGGIGAFGALLLALIRRSLTWHKFWHVLRETGQVTAAICFLFISAHIYALMITVTGVPNALEDLIIQSGVGFMGLLIIYLVIIILLGTILDAGSIMLIMVPIVIPLFLVMESNGVDIVSITWIGLLTIIGVEIGLLTPPLGLACFVIHNNLQDIKNLQDRKISVGDVFRGAAPFALVMLLVLILIVMFPEIAMVLL